MTWNIFGFGKSGSEAAAGNDMNQHSNVEPSALDSARNAAYSFNDTSVTKPGSPAELPVEPEQPKWESAQWQDKNGTVYPEGTNFWRYESHTKSSGKYRGHYTPASNHLQLPDGTTLSEHLATYSHQTRNAWDAQLRGGAKLKAFERYSTDANGNALVDLQFQPRRSSATYDITRTPLGAELGPIKLEDGTEQFQFNLHSEDLSKLLAIRDQFPTVPNPEELSVAEQLGLDFMRLPK